MNAVASIPVADAQRERWLVGSFVCVALALGVFAAAGTSSWLGASVIVLCVFVAAMTVPQSWLAPMLAALIPLQIYFNIPGTSFSTRGVVVFAFVAAFRLLVVRVLRRDLNHWHEWMYPAALFLLAAFIAAFGASNRYTAFRGLYDFGILFAVAFVVSETMQSSSVIRWTVFALIGAGIFQAVVGLWEAFLGTDAIVRFLLDEPIVELFWQSGMLRDNLLNWAINWIVFDRVAPFGTFVNGIDYAIFLAAILSLVLALIIARFDVTSPAKRGRARVGVFILIAIALLIGGTLLWTFKGSGFVAMASGVVTIGLLYLPRLSRRTMSLVWIALAGVIVLSLPFANLLIQRASFLIQREQGAYGTAGRIEIWMSMLQFLLQRPIFGYGLHNSIYLPEAARSLLGGAIVFNLTSTESSYIAILLETGMVGFVALMSVFALAWRRGYSWIQSGFSPAMAIGVMAAMVAILAGNLTVAGFTSDHNEMLLGLFVGMAFGKWNNQR